MREASTGGIMLRYHAPRSECGYTAIFFKIARNIKKHQRIFGQLCSANLEEKYKYSEINKFEPNAKNEQHSPFIEKANKLRELSKEERKEPFSNLLLDYLDTCFPECGNDNEDTIKLDSGDIQCDIDLTEAAIVLKSPVLGNMSEEVRKRLKLRIKKDFKTAIVEEINRPAIDNNQSLENN